MALLLAGSAAWAQVAVLNPLVPERNPSVERVRNLFLGRSTTWSDGSLVTIILIDDVQEDSDLISVVGRDHTRLLRGWKRLVYSGAGAMPVLAASRSEALERVAHLPGAIAIVSQAPEDPRWIRQMLSVGFAKTAPQTSP
jgi:hypothetical protein